MADGNAIILASVLIVIFIIIFSNELTRQLNTLAKAAFYYLFLLHNLGFFFDLWTFDNRKILNEVVIWP